MKERSKDPSNRKDESTPNGKGAAGVDNPQKNSPDVTDDMNADELAAFEKIMGEIEGQEEEKLSGTATGKEDDQGLNEAELATLNEVIEAINKEDNTAAESADDTQPAVQPIEDGGEDSLDEDQQKAFESIMAQIESGDGSDPDDDSATEKGDALESGGPDDFSAELEKVIEDAKTAEIDVNHDVENTEADDALDGDQQKAFESIMAQIEGGNTEPIVPDPDTAESTDPQPEAKSGEEEKSAGPANDETEADAQDISDDIEDILKEINSQDSESDQQAAAATDDPVPHAADVEEIEKTILDDDIVVHRKNDRSPVRADRPQTSAAAEKDGNSTEPAEKPSPHEPSEHRRPAHTSPAGLKTRERSKPLRETAVPTAGRKKITLTAWAVALLFLALAAYYYWPGRNVVDSRMPSPVRDTDRPEPAVTTQPAPNPEELLVVAGESSDHARLKTATENLDQLRNELIEKQVEIEELRAYYQAGIDAEIQGIIHMIRKADKGTISLKTAIADPHINLGLSAIQRRDTYIKKLQTPVNELFWNSEEMLYFTRKAELLAMMAGKTSDLDIDGFIKRAEEVINVHGSTLAQLNIDAVAASPLALESIWQDIEKRLPGTPAKPETDTLAADTDNAVIWKEICDGNFSRKHKLTALSADAARCLATWKGKDLFLNGLTDLSPDAADHLSAWEGDWLGLNGLKELSPEAAVHLSRWKGKGLSLNGLSRLSPRVVAILSDWQGDQIELVNVKHMAHWENPKTRLYLSEDLKRKLNATRK